MNWFPIITLSLSLSPDGQIFDRLLASIGQDTLDTLFLVAAEGRRRKRHLLQTLLFFAIATTYVCILLYSLQYTVWNFDTNPVIVSLTLHPPPPLPPLPSPLPLTHTVIHTVVVLFQAVALNVAVNSYSKALLTILVSNNFVELKGSVFKKFETNNLFQMTCSGMWLYSAQFNNVLLC